MDLTVRLRGKKIGDVLTNGHILKLCTDDGAEINIAWLDDNGRPIKGKPAIVQHGLRLIAAGTQDLINHPAAAGAVRGRRVA